MEAWQELKGGHGERQKMAKKGGGLAAPERTSTDIVGETTFCKSG